MSLAPLLSSLSSEIFPLSLSEAIFTRYSPKPAPLDLWVPLTNMSNTESFTFVAIPCPLSSIHTDAPELSVVIDILQ